MIFSENQISELKDKISKLISSARYNHTLGVEKAVTEISKLCAPNYTCELRVAALLHDISKEKSEAELRNNMDLLKLEIDISEDDFMTPAVWHSIDAINNIRINFNDFATDNILSAIFNHTVGSPDMSLFDEILFVADYVEDNRKYKSCIDVRSFLFSSLKNSSSEDCENVLHEATIMILNNTIEHVIRNNLYLHTATVKTRNAFISKKRTLLDT